MVKIKPIQSDSDYSDALDNLKRLIALDPEPETEEGMQLSVLSTLIEDYEKKSAYHAAPTAIEAIEFRMDQLGMKPVDLVPFIGSRGRVSDILSGRRQLTVDMIRALEEGLGIPAKSLLNAPPRSDEAVFSSWNTKLFKLMSSRGYFGKDRDNKVMEKTLESFFLRANLIGSAHALLRQSQYRTAPSTNRNALIAWSSYVFLQGEKKSSSKFSTDNFNLKYMQELAKLSKYEDGPLRVIKELHSSGVEVVIEPPLPGTRLDGAALFKGGYNPVIGLTLRHDRLDNFWFTLMHELAHVALHSHGDDNDEVIFDELEKIKGLNVSSKEREADSLAGEALVPNEIWEVSPAKITPSPIAAKSLADRLDVSVAIIAGKIRFESGNWSRLNKAVSSTSVRELFPEKSWEEI